MIVHIAIYKWKRGTAPQDVKYAIKEVRSLKRKVKGLIDIHCGENFSKWNERYTHAFIVLAKNQKALDAYRNHPDHIKVAKKIDQMDGGPIGIDFED